MMRRTAASVSTDTTPKREPLRDAALLDGGSWEPPPSTVLRSVPCRDQVRRKRRADATVYSRVLAVLAALAAKSGMGPLDACLGHFGQRHASPLAASLWPRAHSSSSMCACGCDRCQLVLVHSLGLVLGSSRGHSVCLTVVPPLCLHSSPWTSQKIPPLPWTCVQLGVRSVAGGLLTRLLQSRSQYAIEYRG